MGMFSFLRRPRLDPAAKAALVVYLKAEIELAAVQTKASDEYIRAVEEASVLQNLVEATSRYLETLNSIAIRHASIEVPSEGTDCFLAHEILFKSYVHWGEARLLGYSNTTQAQEDAESAADKTFMRAREEADKAKGRLLRTLGVSTHELVKMMQEARDIHR